MSFQVADASSGGLCLLGDRPILFDVSEPTQATGPTRFNLRLNLPGGRVAGGIEAVQVWETRQSNQVLSGWRFVAVPTDARTMLEEEVGLAPPIPEEPASPPDRYYDEEEIELWDYVEVLIRRRWMIAACTILALALGMAVAYVWPQPPLYTAQAQILPMGEVDYLSRREGLGFEAGSKTPYIAILKSRPLNKAVATRRYTLSTTDINGAQADVEQTLVEYLYQLSAAPPKPEQMSDREWRRRLEASALGWLGENASFIQNKSIIDISCTARQPDIAAQVANAYIDEIKAYLLRSSRQYAEQNIAMDRTRLDTLAIDVERAEKELEGFRTANQQLLLDTVDVKIVYPDVAMRDTQLTRALRLKQSLYNTVASQFEMLRLQSSKNVAGVQIVAVAEPPLGASKSRKAIPLSGVVGLFLGVFGAFILEYVDSKRQSGGLTALAKAWRQDTAWLRRLRPR